MTALFFNISGGEIFIILLIIFIFFGPDKIPEIARWLGKGVNEVKKATSDIRDEINRESSGVKKSADSITKEIEQAVNSDSKSVSMDKKFDEDDSEEPPSKAQS